MDWINKIKDIQKLSFEEKCYRMSFFLQSNGMFMDTSKQLDMKSKSVVEHMFIERRNRTNEEIEEIVRQYKVLMFTVFMNELSNIPIDCFKVRFKIFE